MARTLVKGNAELEVVEHVILQNMWEYFVTEKPDEHGVGWALVVGDAVEYGTVAEYDIRKYGISRTTDLTELMPAPNWSWKNA